MPIITAVVSNTDQGTDQKKNKSGTGREYEKKIGNEVFQNEKNREFPTSREEWHP